MSFAFVVGKGISILPPSVPAKVKEKPVRMGYNSNRLEFTQIHSSEFPQ